MMLVSIEDQIIKATIGALLEAGYLLGINDGEETTVSRSADPDQIFSAMKTTDEDYLLVYEPGSGPRHDSDSHGCDGWVWFVHGNDDIVLFNDYTVNLEPVMVKITEMIAQYEEGG